MYIMNEGFQRAVMGYGMPRTYGRMARSRYWEGLATSVKAMQYSFDSFDDGSARAEDYHVKVTIQPLNCSKIQITATNGKTLRFGESVFAASVKGVPCKIYFTYDEGHYFCSISFDRDSGFGLGRGNQVEFDLNAMRKGFTDPGLGKIVRAMGCDTDPTTQMQLLDVTFYS